MDWISTLSGDLPNFVRKLSQLPDAANHLAKFATLVRQRGKEHRQAATTIACEAWKMASANPAVREQTYWAISQQAPAWHFRIANDAERSAIYARALKQYVRPDMTVLEIGTGSAILAMLAVEAGAHHVYTCEMHPLVADVARENIARNGLSERITVIPKASTAVEISADLPEKADLLVSEIVDSTLLGENVLAVMEDAWARLLKREAIVVPGRIAIRGALVGGSRWTFHCRVDRMYGYDLSALNRLSPLRVIAEDNRYPRLEEALSEPFDVFEFDIAGPGKWPAETKTLSVAPRKSGPVDGLLHWIRLDFGRGTVFENVPLDRSTSWSPMLSIFPETLHVGSGQHVQLHVEHDRNALFAWPLLPSVSEGKL